jgi:SSS family solute:Na+ symporter
MGVIGAGFLHIITPFFFVFPGVLAYKILGPNFKPGDAAYLTLVERLVWPGLRGLILAAMAAALMSNLSAVLNSASTLVTLDFYKKLINPQSTDLQQVRFGRFAGTIILIASAVIAWTISLRDVPLFVQVQNVFFWIAPPFSVIFCAGLLWRRANTFGALATIILGFAITPVLDRYMPGVYLHRAFFSWCFCVIVMAVASMVTAPPPAEKVAPIIWTRQYAKLPLEEKQKYHGIRDWRVWWLLFVGIILAIYGWFLWFRFQHPVKMLPW